MQGSTSRRTMLPADVERRLDKHFQAHFDSPADRSVTPLFITLLRLRQFASSIKSNQSQNLLGELLPALSAPATTTDVVRHLADSFCSGTPGIESELLKKSVQEALLTSVDVQADATVVQFQQLLQQFLKRQGTDGLLRLFVGLHMYNVVWLELIESDFF